MLGVDQPIHLKLLDLPFATDALSAVIMEINDCALPLVKSVTPTSDYEEAFTGVDGEQVISFA